MSDAGISMLGWLLVLVTLVLSFAAGSLWAAKRREKRKAREEAARLASESRQARRARERQARKRR